jgi:two-component system, OmpR family, alkaline phosphatase synthesis response regulator PhoP
MRILLVEDEKHIAEALVFNFGLQKYKADLAESGEQALEFIETTQYDLIVLDVMLPGIDGFEVARTIRKKDGRIPILMLTALSADEDRIAGLESGVDDYLIKPFVLKELLLRIAGLLRRSKWYAPPPEEPFKFGIATIDPGKLTAARRNKKRALTRIEVDLMRYFIANPDRLISREELLSKVWGYEPDTATRTVDTFILRVRKIIEPEPSKPVFLTSLRGGGYLFHPAGSKKKNKT